MNYYIPPLSKINKNIIIISSILFLLGSFYDLRPLLGLNIQQLSSGFIFELITFPFIEKNFTSHLFNCLVVWFFGSELEFKLGAKSYIQFLLAGIISCALSFILISIWVTSPFGLTLYGLGSMCFCMLQAYGAIYGNRILTFMLVFPMKARYFCLLLIGIELYMGLFSPSAVMAWGNLGGLIGSILFLKLKYRINLGLPLAFFEKWNFFRKKKKPKLYIVSDDSKKPRYWQ